jgi:hypothetical protein
MGWIVLGLRPTGDRGVRSDSKEVCARHEVVGGMSFARADGRGPTETEVRAHEGLDRGRSPQRFGRLSGCRRCLRRAPLERGGFPQNHAGLRSLECWAKRFPERRWAVENAGGLGRHLAGKLTAAGECVVDVPPKLSARVRVLSTGNALAYRDHDEGGDQRRESPESPERQRRPREHVGQDEERDDRVSLH